MGQSCSAQVVRAEVVPLGANDSCLAPSPAVPNDHWAAGDWVADAPCVPISTENFMLAHRGGSSSSRASSSSREDWRRRYAMRSELGHGVSATVFEAEASPEACSGGNWSLLGGSILPDPGSMCGTGSSVSCLRENRRRVALKRFKRLRSRSFQTERAALQRVGVHPNIVRLLESYEDFGGEDVLVLEYCDGATVFDIQADSRKLGGDGVSELLCAKLLRQVLLALEHLGSCGVEHQDVKPENMLLYDVSMVEQRAQLKLGDFGWAVPARGSSSRLGLCSASEEDVPQDGAGSLWYAPPELNPPVPLEQPGCSGATLAKLRARTPRSSGRADMWSVGVVAYVLLVGQNPFAAALVNQTDKRVVEAEVLRLVAAGSYDRTDPNWISLPDDARDFVEALLKVNPSSRLSAADALRHPFLVRRCARCLDTKWSEPAWRLPTVDNSAWARMDGFQHLCWLAVARAVTEPELLQETVQSAVRSSRSSGAGTVSYLWHLAREISSVPTGCWLLRRGAWAEVLRLAFSYLDVNGDGVLCAKDLASHVSTKGLEGQHQAWSAAKCWVAKWARSWDEDSSDVYPMAGLDPECFRTALRTMPPEVGTLLDCSELPDGLEMIAEGGDLRKWEG